MLIHRAIFGSLERFLALLLEQYAGRWPFWLSPRQGIILTVNQDEAVVQQAHEASAKIAGFQALLSEHTSPASSPPKPLSSMDSTFMIDVDTSSQTLGKKIQRAKQMKYNLIFILGSKDIADSSITMDVTGQMQSPPDGNERTLEEVMEQHLGATSLQNPRSVKMKVDEAHSVLVQLEKHFL